jgi:FtsP/CotA-like multicopper oxidase with cupredoxin domain
MDRRNVLGYSGGGDTFSLFVNSPLFISSCKKKQHNSMKMKRGNAAEIIEAASAVSHNYPSVKGRLEEITTKFTNQTTYKKRYSQVSGYHSKSILVPAIKINSGDRIKIKLQNQPSGPGNIHRHRLVNPALMDDHSSDTAHSGSSFKYCMTVTQRAALNWFHPHIYGYTVMKTYKGLDGIFRINDMEEQDLNRPSGIFFTIRLIIQGKQIFRDYTPDYAAPITDITTQNFEQYFFVNGDSSPLPFANKCLYLIRVINGSNARINNPGLNKGFTFSEWPVLFKYAQLLTIIRKLQIFIFSN